MKTITATLVFAILTLSSCSKSNDDEPQIQHSINRGVEISLKNINGEDLLDPNKPNSYNAENIKLYYLINGEKQEVFDQNMDYPRNFLIFKHESEYRIRIFQNDTETEIEPLPITFVEWNATDTDTLQAEFYKADGLIQVIKTWFNGELKWDGENGQENFFTIIK